MSDTHPHPYSIKRHGTNIRDCEAEPIKTPGCIQAHGVLIALRCTDMTVLQISENCHRFFGRTAEGLLGQAVHTLIGEPAAAQLRAVMDRDPIERNPLYVATVNVVTNGAVGFRMDMSVHTINGVALVELEPAGRDADRTPPDYYALVKKTAARLHSAETLESFCTIAAQEVRKITGLDRVMIYRFHPDASGEVFAEDKRADLPSWKGQRYPAYDIPKIARDIFTKLTIRPLPDAQGELAELVPLANPDNGEPLELTHCALRGASVMYSEYLANMGVAASLTMPILRDGELWGMVACHHGRPTEFSFQTRTAAEFVSQIITLEMRPVEDREHFEYIKQMDAVHLSLIARAASEGGLSVMAEPSPQLLDGIESSGAAVFHRERWWSVGRTPLPGQLDKLGRWLKERLSAQIETRPYYVTDRLAGEYAPAAQFTDVASGLLAVPISKNCTNLIVWFRPETAQTVTWAGDPTDKPSVVGPNGPRLTPRASFEQWKETVRERSTPWKPVEIEAALKLRMLVMDLVVTRAELIAALNSDLARSNEELDAFAYVASHDLKEPLRGIHKYAWYLMEDAKAGRSLDAVAKERLDSLLRLTVRMDGLLNSLLHFSRVGRLDLEYEELALEEVLRESLEMLGAQIDERKTQVVVPRPLPHVHCDRVRVREIFSNLIGNAIKYNDSDIVRIEVGYVDAAERPSAWAEPGSKAASTAGQVFYVRDNGIGIDPKHHEQIFAMFKRLHGRDAYGGGTGAGLAITRKLVQQHGGSIWVESASGDGATFFFTLSRTSSEHGDP